MKTYVQTKPLVTVNLTKNNAGALVETRSVSDGYTRNLNVGVSVKGNFRDPNPWNYTYASQSMLIGRSYTANGFPYFIWRDINGVIGSPPLSHPDVGLAMNVAYNKAISNLNKKTRGELDLSVAAAESKQTVKMVMLVNRLREGLTYMKKSFVRNIWNKVNASRRRAVTEKQLRNWQRDIKSRYAGSFSPVPVNQGIVSKVSSLAANGWLEFTYGWKPLISDIYNVADTVIDSLVRHKLNRFKARGTVGLQQSVPVAYTPSGGQGGLCNCKGVCSYTFHVLLTNNFDPGFSKWSSLNPLSIAYELTPYSFVLDWVWDFGSYMRNLETSLLFGTSVQKASLSQLTVYHLQTIINGRKNGTSIVATGGYSSCSFRRTVLTSYPVPQVPRFHVNLGSSRLLSAASLMRQLIRR